MNDLIGKDKEYFVFIQEIKKQVQNAQIKAAVSVNQELLQLYWRLGQQIVEKQKQTSWGDGFLTRMSKDLREEFPEVKGFSLRNLKYIRQWYLFWFATSSIGQQAVAQIPWGHNLVILNKAQSLSDEFKSSLRVLMRLKLSWGVGNE